MLGVLSRAFDRFRGSGIAAVTIPSLDGAFRPNQQLDAASVLIEIAAPDNLASDGRRTVFSSGAVILALNSTSGGTATPEMEFGSLVTAIGLHADGGMAVGLADGGIALRGGRHDGRQLTTVADRPIKCPTALRFADARRLIVCLGSQQNDPTQWKRDFLDSNASGSVWMIDLDNGEGTCLADRLAWPNGVVEPEPGRIVVAESWRHQLLDLAGDRSSPLLADLPGYPARLTPARGGGYWLTIFAPRSQLIEFVLRERRFRERMMSEIEPEFWVAPSLHHLIDYREPLQSGAIKQLGELKPWSPSRSYGLIVRLDEEFNPVESFHSRANGKRHGITSCIESDGRLLATSKGGGVVLAIEPTAREEPTA
jgi:hypothetical protein